DYYCQSSDISLSAVLF
nr:immunoglobulin light chain junction region [Macaca mulatta]MOX69080.1 immunoglobulin light chain junction region [Macaca mulatta]MOX69317.1 immunoglobulin light chain junction region [Macaca mulatta]MOX69443.1 immunoglobulin light chain junction region [Macaca mulatta]MOX69468.1 immunoglobulin light chain junction region [Macaca mulatta]